jgi:hypothetical protein
MFSSMHYNSIGNKELRDKYIEVAIQRGVDDAALVFLRGTLQEQPDLIPDEVADRELERRAKDQDWSQRARLLVELDRYLEATEDYLKSVQNGLENHRYFSAAHYLKEMVEEGCIEHLFIQALKEATEEDNLWWQARALQELGWDDELRERVLAASNTIKQERNPLLLELLAWANKDWSLYTAMRKAIAEGSSSGPKGWGWIPLKLDDDVDVEGEEDHPTK